MSMDKNQKFKRGDLVVNVSRNKHVSDNYPKFLLILNVDNCMTGGMIRSSPLYNLLTNEGLKDCKYTDWVDAHYIHIDEMDDD